MKKISKLLGMILIFSILMLICNNVNAATVTLEQIVEKFNNSSFIDDYKNTGGDLNATYDSDSINVTIKSNGNEEVIELTIDGNVLLAEIGVEAGITKTIVTAYVIDAIGQVHGYNEGDLTATLNSDKVKSYTLEEEGYEVEEISETKSKIKVDITKKIPLADFADTYIEVSDLQDLKEYISGDGSAEKSKGDIWFNKSGNNGEYTLLVAEKGDLTENTYKSVLSILKVMFDNDKVIEMFQNNYPNISSGDKEFDGVSIKVNPTDKTDWEERLIPSDSEYEFVRIVVDKEKVVESVTKEDEKKTEEPKDNDTEESKKEELEEPKKEIPNAGLEKNGFLFAIYIIAGTYCFIVIVRALIERRRK